MEEASACQPYVKFFVSESLQDVAGGKHTPVTSPGALSTSVWLVMLVVCVCGTRRFVRAYVHRQLLCSRELLKIDAFCIVDAGKLFFCSYGTLMFQSVRILDVELLHADNDVLIPLYLL